MERGGKGRDSQSLSALPPPPPAYPACLPPSPPLRLRPPVRSLGKRRLRIEEGRERRSRISSSGLKPPFPSPPSAEWREGLQRTPPPTLFGGGGESPWQRVGVLRRETAFPFQERRGGSWRTYLCAFTPLVYVPSRTHKHSALSYGRSEITEPYSWQKISLILLSPLRGQRLNLDIARAILSQRERVSSSSLVNPHPTSASLFYTNRLEEEDGNASPPPPPPVFCPHPFSLKTALLSSSPVAASALGLTGCQQMRERRGKHYLTKRQLL